MSQENARHTLFASPSRESPRGDSRAHQIPSMEEVWSRIEVKSALPAIEESASVPSSRSIHLNQAGPRSTEDTQNVLTRPDTKNQEGKAVWISGPGAQPKPYWIRSRQIRRHSFDRNDWRSPTERPALSGDTQNVPTTPGRKLTDPNSLEKLSVRLVRERIGSTRRR